MIRGCIVVFVVIPFIINGLFKIPVPMWIFQAEYSAGDMLVYVSGAMAFIGTMFLGWIAYKQNDDLKKIEENNFIALNECMELLSSVSLKDMDKIAVNLEEEHGEIILEEKGIRKSNYQSFRAEIFMERMTKIPASFVHVSQIMMWFDGEKDERKSSFVIFADAHDDYYTRVAISKEQDGFGFTVLLKPETKQKVLKCLEQKGTLLLEMEMELISPNYVMSKMKNRATFSNSNKTENTNFEIVDAKPLSYWKGSEVISKEDIKFRQDS